MVSGEENSRQLPTRKRPVVNLDFLVPEKKKKHPSPMSSSVDSEPGMGITTASTMQLPFTIDENDPLFQQRQGAGVLDVALQNQASMTDEKQTSPRPTLAASKVTTHTVKPSKINQTSPLGQGIAPRKEGVSEATTRDNLQPTLSAAAADNLPVCTSTVQAVLPSMAHGASTYDKRITPVPESGTLDALSDWETSTDDESMSRRVDTPVVFSSDDEETKNPAGEGESAKERSADNQSDSEMAHDRATPSVEAQGGRGEDPSPETPPLCDNGHSSHESDYALLKEIMQKIDRDIIRCEEEHFLKRIDLSIALGAEAEKPGGRVLYLAKVKLGRVVEEPLPARQDPLYLDAPPARRRKPIVEANERENKCGNSVLGLVDMANEVCHKIRLPKYFGHPRRFFLSAELIQTKVVDMIMTEERKFVPMRRKVAVILEDDSSDPHSIFLSCQGHPELVEDVESRVTSLIRAEQPQPPKLRVEQQHPAKSIQSGRKATTTKSGNKRGRDILALKSDEEKKMARARKNRANVAQFHKFLESYSVVMEIEYLGVELHKSHINGCMWAQHKKRYGTSCGEDCKCPKDIDFLTRTVVSSHVDKETRKDPSWKPPRSLKEDESPVGFITHFAPKFFPMLEAEFPVETPKQILTRLTNMWREHRKMQLFGITCKSKCPCGEGWELVFKKGRVHEDEKVAYRAGSTAIATSSSTRIPRRLSSDAATNSRPSTLVPPHELLPVTRTSLPTIAKKSEGAMTMQAQSLRLEPYELVFRPGETLGCYFITVKQKDGSVCKIASLSDIARTKDPRLSPGTIVTHASTLWGSVRTSVRNHADLKRMYEQATQSQMNLRVRFTNTGITGSLIANMQSSDWAPSGEYIGSLKNGWAGGAKNAGKMGDSAEQPARASREPSLRPQSIEQTTAKTADTETQWQALPQPESQLEMGNPLDLEYSTTMSPAQHRELAPSASILRGSLLKKSPPKATSGSSIQRYMPGIPATSSRKGKVNFTDDFEMRFYDPQIESYRLATAAGQHPIRIKSPKREGPALTSTMRKALKTPKDLINATKHDSVKEVIVLLQAGACPHTRDGMGKSSKDYAKSRLNALNYELKSNPDNSELIALAKDFDRKRSVLSIFTEALATIDRARFNKKWERYFYKVDTIKDIHLSVSGVDHRGSKVIDCRISVNGEAMRPMPHISIEHRMEEWKNNTEVCDNNAFSYNPSIMAKWPAKRKEIDIDLYKGSKKDVEEPVLLGKTIIPFTRIISEIEKGGAVIEEKLQLSDYLVSGSVSIKAQKGKDRSIRESKAQEAASRLRVIIERIKRFNSETELDRSKVPALSAQIVEPKSGISLLHAAIYLDEPALVSQLLDLGADSAAPSPVGTARYLAANLFEMKKDDDGKSLEVLRLLGMDVPSKSLVVVADQDDDGTSGESPKSLHSVSTQPSDPSAIQTNRSLAAHDGDDDGASGESPKSLHSVSTQPSNPSAIQTNRSLAAHDGDDDGTSCASPKLLRSVSTQPSDPAAIQTNRNLAAHGGDEDDGASGESPKLLRSVSTQPSDPAAIQTNHNLAAHEVLSATDTAARRVIGEQSPLSSGAVRTHSPLPDEWYKQRLCKKFSQGEACPFGKACHFAHGEQELMCKRFLQGEDCHYGAMCRYSHGKLDRGRCTVLHEVGKRDQVPASVPHTSLPLLDYWFHQGEQRCKNFNSAKGCSFADRCDFQHCSPPIGRDLDENSLEVGKVDLPRDDVVIKRRQNDSGQEFYTAAYKSKRDSTVYQAERGLTVGQSKDGVYWYNTERDALEAVKMVVMWHHVSDSQNSNFSGHHAARTDNRPRYEGAVASGHRMSSSNVLFHRLLTANLSTLSQQIVGENLRKTDWTITEKKGFVTASFFLQGLKYCACNVQSGLWFDGAWWHFNERAAKASAFLTFVESCIQRGDVTADCAFTRDGKSISGLSEAHR